MQLSKSNTRMQKMTYASSTNSISKYAWQTGTALYYMSQLPLSGIGQMTGCSIRYFLPCATCTNIYENLTNCLWRTFYRLILIRKTARNCIAATNQNALVGECFLAPQFAVFKPQSGYSNPDALHRFTPKGLAWVGRRLCEKVAFFLNLLV